MFYIYFIFNDNSIDQIKKNDKEPLSIYKLQENSKLKTSLKIYIVFIFQLFNFKNPQINLENIQFQRNFTFEIILYN